MFLASLCFHNNICSSLNECLFTLREAVHWVGQFIMERKHGVNAEFLGLWYAGGLRESMSPSRLSSCTMRSIWHLSLRVSCRLEPKQGLGCCHPVQWNISLMIICFRPWLSNGTSTNRFGLSCLNQGIQLSDLWTDQEDISPYVPLTIMTMTKLVIICLHLPWVPWPLRPSYSDGHGLDLWSSSTSRQKHRCRDPLFHD